MAIIHDCCSLVAAIVSPPLASLASTGDGQPNDVPAIITDSDAEKLTPYQL